MKREADFNISVLIFFSMLFLSHCQVTERQKDVGNKRPIADFRIRFHPPSEYEKVLYNDFWNTWTDGDECYEILGEVWKGFYRHKIDTFKRVFLVEKKISTPKGKVSWKQFASKDSSYIMESIIGSYAVEQLSKKLYYDTESDKNKDSLLISEVFGRSKRAWRTKRVSEFQEMQYKEPIDSMYHYEITIRGRVLFGFDVARDTIFPTEEYRQEAIRIWNLIEFDD